MVNVKTREYECVRQTLYEHGQHCCQEVKDWRLFDDEAIVVYSEEPI